MIPHGYCIQLIHCHGGSFTILGADASDAKARAAKQCSVFRGAYVAATLPFPVFIGRLGVPDCSIPHDCRDALYDVMRLYLNEDT